MASDASDEIAAARKRLAELDSTPAPNVSTALQTLRADATLAVRVLKTDDDQEGPAAHEILPGLWLGNRHAARSNVAVLRAVGIKSILCLCAGEMPALKCDGPKLALRAEDSPEYDLSQHFPECFQFLDQNCPSLVAGAEGGDNGVLVHCMAGASRSATMVVAYIMRKYRVSAQEALSVVERKRWVVSPNSGFMRQLSEFDKVLQQEYHLETQQPVEKAPIRLTIITCKACPRLCADDLPLLTRLAELRPDVHVTVSVWNSPETPMELNNCDACIVRTPWDCVDDMCTFQRFVSSVPCPVENDPLWLAWTSDKSYLTQLHKDGVVPCVPSHTLPKGQTLKAITAILNTNEWHRAVLKPAVGSFGNRVLKLPAGSSISPSSADGKQIQALLSWRDTILQPFVSSIQSLGEVSLVFFDGKLSHAVRKSPRHGDFRVQGGNVNVWPSPPANVVKLGETALAVSKRLCGASSFPLWCRVDLLPGSSTTVAETGAKGGAGAERGGGKHSKHKSIHGPGAGGREATGASKKGEDSFPSDVRWVVSEIEALDPELYFKYGGSKAVEKAVDAIVKRLDGHVSR